MRDDTEPNYTVTNSFKPELAVLDYEALQQSINNKRPESSGCFCRCIGSLLQNGEYFG
jgi:hypothetical protein